MLFKKNSGLLISIIYSLVFIVEIYALSTKNIALEIKVKPFLMPLILLLYVTAIKKINWLYILIIFLVWIGDCFMIYNKDIIPLLMGITAFTLASILYFFLLKNDFKKIPVNVVLSSFMAFVISIGIVFYIISDQLNNFFWPVLANAFMLSLLANMVFLNYLYNNNLSNKLLFIGMFLFVVANCLFGIYRFHTSINLYVVIVAFFYTIGQYLICLSMINRVNI